MNELSREQVEKRLENLKYNIVYVPSAQREKTVGELLAYDAALRGKLEAMTQERDADREECTVANRALTHTLQQLAASEQERDALKERRKVEPVYGSFAHIDELEQQLAAMTTKHENLALRLMEQEESYAFLLECIEGKEGWREQLETVKRVGQQYVDELAAMTQERDEATENMKIAVTYHHNEQGAHVTTKQQLAASEQRVRQLEGKLVAAHASASERVKIKDEQLTEAQNTIARLEQDNAAARGELRVSLEDSPPGSLANRLVIANRILRSERYQLQATITAQQEEIVRLRAACQVSKVGAINASCGHSSYWVTAYGNCIACRAEQAEKRLEALASGKEAT